VKTHHLFYQRTEASEPPNILISIIEESLGASV